MLQHNSMQWLKYECQLWMNSPIYKIYNGHALQEDRQAVSFCMKKKLWSCHLRTTFVASHLSMFIYHGVPHIRGCSTRVSWATRRPNNLLSLKRFVTYHRIEAWSLLSRSITWSMLGDEGIRLKFILRDKPQCCNLILITFPLWRIQNLVI